MPRMVYIAYIDNSWQQFPLGDIPNSDYSSNNNIDRLKKIAAIRSKFANFLRETQAVIASGNASAIESNLFELCDDIGYIEYLVENFPEEQLSKLEAKGNKKPWEK